MDKQAKAQTYMLSVNEYGQKICTSQLDPSKKYVLDEDGNMTEYFEPPVCRIKVDTADEEECIEIPANTIEELDNPTQHLELLHHFEGVADFDAHLMSELDADIMNLGVSDSNQPHYIMQHMDIREPLVKLRKLLEQRLGVNLAEYKFTLQGAQALEESKNLVDQCVQGEGLVQVNVQVQALFKRINIIDVLKPAEDYIHIEENNDEAKKPEEAASSTKPAAAKPKNIVQWQVDMQYKSDQERLRIPSDPINWTILHVRHWVQWAVRQFNLPNVKLSDWSISGKDLYNLGLRDFQKIVPHDPGDVFWTHIELLRQMKVVAIKRDEPFMPAAQPTISKALHNKYFPSSPSSNCPFENSLINRSGTNGQIQLWQFLLELLTSKKYKAVIQWIGSEGEFKLTHPEVVACLWGERKNKPKMNYEKLSRALRYYYDGDMISKVHGYNAVELSNLVNYGCTTVIY